jgi:hypothetical protein
MAGPDRRRQWIALILSGVFPGLGQFYVRAWAKGAVFLAAGAVVTWALGRLTPAEELLAGRLPGAAVVALLALLGLYAWSIIDAWRSAGTPRA